MIIQILIFIVSLAVLLKAADWFIESAEAIGLSFGIPSFVIGITIVAFGTSLPELATSIASVYSGKSDVVIGNVVGSNITNILLVLGFTAFVGKKIVLDFDIMDIDMPMLFASAFFLYIAVMDQHLSILEAILFLVALSIFLANSFTGDNKSEKVEREPVSGRTWLFFLLGGVLVYFGSTYTIDSLIKISESLSIDPYFISIIVLALGTSLPELVVSVSAAKKGKTSIAVGNILGSNIFNSYAVMAIPRFFGDLKIPDESISFHMPFMIAATMLFAIMCISGRISKWEGAILLVLYTYFIGEQVSSLL
ncbi:MAG TPA: calcium/sodium antiporter [Saprospiraceae bacterium]|nr:calcium/sodium antiporter [Saprospiraceae bacterium]HPQ21801.1 calcium/sodium antiporter [Saprospiraceae bacterium]HRX29997.1 calcium/sodium antiporter [Saprospiraceae bacterium]